MEPHHQGKSLKSVKIYWSLKTQETFQHLLRTIIQRCQQSGRRMFLNKHAHSFVEDDELMGARRNHFHDDWNHQRLDFHQGTGVRLSSQRCMPLVLSIPIIVSCRRSGRSCSIGCMLSYSACQTNSEYKPYIRTWSDEASCVSGVVDNAAARDHY